jgi:hypothetical protein
MRKDRNNERALARATDYVRSDAFKRILRRDDKKLLLAIIHTLGRKPVRGNLNAHLQVSAQTVSEINYLYGKYEAKREYLELKNSRLKAKLEIDTRNSYSDMGIKPTKGEVDAEALLDRTYYKRVQQTSKCKALVRLIEAMKKGADSRFRALEQVSNNDRIAMRDKE